MTCAFIKSSKENPGQSYQELLHSIRKIIQSERYEQIPQLESSRLMNTSLKFIL
ncbi:uncharacterized protein EV420DRAFT_1524071 [Desarmillaria tabescens]|uniref:Uncharacterized protein n=1 Tax=Armillaria tabescens TaxID=1929756 RepID=A0AA39TXH5_ARMTA|nr:uncharacterized protein EV420DRAFT_1524071 [Desarmillaria tabescens]KAK0462345.1 hypothetical protein EV420DRAFT_1524071 [Desarmillaria tabescens]